ncbi:MAG: O-antigen ligase family protein [Aeromicrobium sp.]
MSDVFFLLGFGLLIPTLLIRRFHPPTYFLLGSVVLVVMGLLASLGSTDPGTSLNAMTRLVVSALGLPAAFLLWRPNNKIVLWLASAYVLGQCLSVADALIKGAAPSTGRYQGLATHVNFFGLSALLATCLLPYIAAFIRPSWRWGVLAAAAICSYGVWISGSRAALLVLILVALIFPLVERSVPAAGFLAAGLSFALLLSGKLLNEGGDNALGRLQGDTTTDYSDRERSRALTESIRVFRDHPLLGTGFENALAAHNIYLEIGVAVGVIGVVAYLFVLGSTVYPLFSVPHPYHRLAYPALAYASIGMITNALWDRFIWSALSLAIIATYLAAEAEDEHKIDDVDESSKPKPQEPAAEHI